MGSVVAWGVIRPGSERGRVWRELIGSDAVPLLEALPVRAEVGGFGVVTCWGIDLAALGPAGLARLVRHVASRDGQAARDVQADIIAEGLPLIDGPDLIVVDDPEEGRRYWGAPDVPGPPGAGP